MALFRPCVSDSLACAWPGASEGWSVARAVPRVQSWAFVCVDHRYVDRTHDPSSPLCHVARVFETRHFKPQSKITARNECEATILCSEFLFQKSGDSPGVKAGPSDKPIQACDSVVICPTGLR